jgi:hypothetical protein
MLGGAVLEEGVPRQTEAGGLETRMLFLPAAEGEILDTWHVTGLQGIGSSDVAVHDAVVPEEHSYVQGPAQPRIDGRLSATPQRSLWTAMTAPVLLGIARTAVAALVDLAGTKTPTNYSALPVRERATVQADVARAEMLVRAGRAVLCETVMDMWRTVQARQPMSLEQRALVRAAAAHTASNAAQAVDLMYARGGTTSISTQAAPLSAARVMCALRRSTTWSPRGAWRQPSGTARLGTGYTVYLTLTRAMAHDLPDRSADQQRPALRSSAGARAAQLRAPHPHGPRCRRCHRRRSQPGTDSESRGPLNQSLQGAHGPVGPRDQRHAPIAVAGHSYRARGRRPTGRRRQLLQRPWLAPPWLETTAGTHSRRRGRFGSARAPYHRACGGGPRYARPARSCHRRSRNPTTGSGLSPG